jgi:hypothetical protein
MWNMEHTETRLQPLSVHRSNEIRLIECLSHVIKKPIAGDMKVRLRERCWREMPIEVTSHQAVNLQIC